MENRRVVITGIGIISPIGTGVEQFFSALKEGKCGIDIVTRFDTEGYDAKIAAEVKDFDPLEYIDKKEAKEWIDILNLQLRLRRWQFCHLSLI